MFLPADKLKRDYKITWTESYRVRNEEEVYEENYECIVKDCETTHHAWETWYETILDCDYDDVSYIDVEPVELTHSDRVNAEVYELVLNTLFDGKFGIYQRVYPQIQDDYELTEDLQGLEKILVEHQALMKYNKLSGAV
jgi:hypothetical protein